MIRLSQKNDLNDIIALWNESFGDSEEDIRFFLDSRYIPENTVVCEINGRIVSVLFLLNGSMHINGNDYPSYYLYAACTSNKFRGKGIMGDMLSFSESLSASRNKYFIALKPAEKSLFGYYGRFGYKTVFTKKTAEIVCDFSNIHEFGFDDANAEKKSESRDNIFEHINYFKWDSDSVEFAISHHEYFGGKIFGTKNGYILYFVKDEVLYIRENTLSDNDEFLKVINYLCNLNGTHSVVAELPSDYHIECIKYEISDSGMILPLNNKAEEMILSLNNAYLNLALD